MSDSSINIVVDGDAFRLAQPFTAREVLRLGGILGEGLVIRTDGGRGSLFAPESPVSFEPTSVRPVFRTFRGAMHRLWVDGLRWDWGAPLISIDDVRRIREVAEDAPIRLQGSDRPLALNAFVDLTTDLPPRLVTLPVTADVSEADDAEARPVACDGRRRGRGSVLVRVDGADVVLSRSRLTGAAVLASVGAAARHADILIREHGGAARQVLATEWVDVEGGALATFRVHRGGGLRRIEVDGRDWDWGASEIGEDDIRSILDLDQGRDLFVAGDGQPLRRGVLIDLAAEATTFIQSREGIARSVEQGPFQPEGSVSSTTSKS
jgi:hypothetical protein